MQSSKLGYQVWAMAIYLSLTSLKSVSSMKLHRDLDITQKSAWHLAHRLRKAFDGGGGIFAGPVEMDETYFGGKRANMSKSKREQLTGRGAVGKTAVVGAKDRATKQVAAKVVERTDKANISADLRAAGLQAQVFVWDDFHDRYLISNLVGISLPYGFGSTQDPNSVTRRTRLGKGDRDDVQREFDPASQRHTLRANFMIP